MRISLKPNGQRVSPAPGREPHAEVRRVESAASHHNTETWCSPYPPAGLSQFAVRRDVCSRASQLRGDFLDEGGRVFTSRATPLGMRNLTHLGLNHWDRSRGVRLMSASVAGLTPAPPSRWSQKSACRVSAKPGRSALDVAQPL